MAEVVQFVQTVWTIKDQQALRAARRMQRNFALVATIANRATGAISRMGSALLSPFGIGIGGAAAFGIVKHLIDVGQTAEDAKLSLTALLQQASGSSNLPFGDFTRAQEAALQLRNRFRELAIDSPVTAKAIRTSFQDTTFFLSKAGLSLDKQAKLARDIALVDRQLGRKGTTGRDVAQILAGRGGLAEIQSPLLKGIAKEAAALAKGGDIAGAAKLIQEKLTPDPALLKAYGNSFGGLIASMSDQLLVLKEEASKPIMEFISAKLQEWIGWLRENQALAKEYAKTFGRNVVGALKAVVRLVKFIAKNWKAIVTTVKILASVWIGAKLASGMSALVGLANAFKIALTGASFAAGGLMSILGPIVGLIGAIAVAIAALRKTGAVQKVARGALDIANAQKEFTKQKGRAGTVPELQAFRRAQTVKEARLLSDKIAKAAIAGGAAATSKDLLAQSLEAINQQDALRGGRRGGGRRVKKMRVQTMLVDKLRPRDKDFARLSTPAAATIARESFARRPLAAAGLAIASTGI